MTSITQTLTCQQIPASSPFAATLVFVCYSLFVMVISIKLCFYSKSVVQRRFFCIVCGKVKMGLHLHVTLDVWIPLSVPKIDPLSGALILLLNSCTEPLSVYGKVTTFGTWEGKDGFHIHTWPWMSWIRLSVQIVIL